jgi:hypothetical protein
VERYTMDKKDRTKERKENKQKINADKIRYIFM